MIKDKLVLITGATSGIGEAAARRLVAEGARVALWGRRAERLNALARELHAITGIVDVRDRAMIDAAIAELVRDAGPPHVLINNAGLGAGFARFHEGNPEDWETNIDTNFKGAAYVARAVIPHMIAAGRGHVINVGSTAAHVVAPRGHVYAATKHAVRALSEGMNIDLAGTPVKVSLLDPGYVKTEFGVVRFLGNVERAMETYRGFQPLSAEDVADAIAWMVSLPEHVNVADLVLVPTAQRHMYVIDRTTE